MGSHCLLKGTARSCARVIQKASYTPGVFCNISLHSDIANNGYRRGKKLGLFAKFTYVLHCLSYLLYGSFQTFPSRIVMTNSLDLA